MMTISSRAAVAAIATLFLMSSAMAQTAAPAPAATPAPKMAPAEKKAEKPRSAASLQCSKDAFGEPDDRLQRVIQYSRAAGDRTAKPRRTGYPLSRGMTEGRRSAHPHL